MWCVVVWRVSSACFVVCVGHTVWCVACGVWDVARGCVAWNFVALLSCVCVRQSTLWHCLSSPAFVRPSTLSRPLPSVLPVNDCSFCSETKKGLLAVCPLPAPSLSCPLSSALPYSLSRSFLRPSIYSCISVSPPFIRCIFFSRIWQKRAPTEV